MQSDYEAFALFWIPRRGTALARFGAGWTGWCAEDGVRSDLPEFRRLRRARPEMPGTSSLLGLHAVLKTPFRLARGRTVWSLDHDLMALAQSLPTIRMPRLEVTVFDGRVVLALSRPSRPIARMVRHIGETARPFEAKPQYTKCSGQTQVAGIDLPGMRAWTDPGDDWIERFHVPLSDRMELGLAFEMVDTLTPALRDVLGEPQNLLDLALVANPGRGRPWRLIERYALAEEPKRSATVQPASMMCRGPRLYDPLDTGMASV